jgi:hypothetical protein
MTGGECAVVDLRNMTNIRSINWDTGMAVIEPGVSQGVGTVPCAMSFLFVLFIMLLGLRLP